MTIRADAHPLVEGLFETLPPPYTAWSREQRERWLSVAARVLEMLYFDEPLLAALRGEASGSGG